MLQNYLYKKYRVESGNEPIIKSIQHFQIALTMEEATDEKTRILLLNSDDLKLQYPSANAQAAVLNSKFNVARKELCLELGCSQAGISRAKACLDNGFNPSRSGRHQKLNDHDEETLVSWIQDLLDEGGTVYSYQVIDMVCLFISVINPSVRLII